MELYGLKKISPSCSDLHEACPYTLEQIIQKGKHSVRVLKAFASESNETVAIKLFPKTIDGQCLPAFLSEGQALANLEHPHILRYHETYSDAVVETGAGKFTEYSAIVMEYVPSGDLYGALSQRLFSEKLARTLFKQMISVFQYLHNQEVVHLDVKLENFLINCEEGVKLIDFESCQKVKQNTRVTAKGTPGYRAPEVVSETYSDLKALDIYSLGIVLFMMVAGTPPYVESQENGTWKFDKYYQVLRNDKEKFWNVHEAYRVADGRPGFSNELKEIIESMLSNDSEKRPKVNDIRGYKWFQGETCTKKELERELSHYSKV